MAVLLKETLRGGGGGGGVGGGLRLLFSLKPKEVAKMRLLAVWIDKR